MCHYKHIRFAPQKLLPPVAANATTSLESQQCSTPNTLREPKRKSKLGCKECRIRRVKCDETFPVCKRCLSRGSICLPAARSQQWIYEMPPTLNGQLPTLLHVKKRQLQYWLEKASQILVIDTENNPFSYPILKYLNDSPALVHAIQSVSMGHETFFDGANQSEILQQRGMALISLREELKHIDTGIYLPAFFTAYILMVSTSSLDVDMLHYGEEHFAGARAVLYCMLQTPHSTDMETLHLLLGYYIYCDMTISFLSEPKEQIESNNELVHTAVRETRHLNHPLVGFSMEIMYLMGTLGRHCRRVLDSGQRDHALEATMEQQMLDWECTLGVRELDSLSNAFRNTGLILLYRICGPSPRTFEHEGETSDSDNPALDTVIRDLALQVILYLDTIPLSSCFVNIFPLPLLTAGSELTAEDAEQRAHVIERFRAVYSFNRIPANMAAIELLKEVWAQRDRGAKLSWIRVMLLLEWRLIVS
ncbi:fungal-specific transcription factor domain-containing protein [Phaeosphaeria sp. MPI-PUGE-AT-0046c]|nr:fungal-specific transcription factor domain-containing protein [Phaeosphaeria sp. MPI-PUGE-AT-0046c]